MNPIQFILLCLAGWINRQQQAVIEYQQEEIRALKEIHGKRLALKAQKIRFTDLREIANIAIPRTLRAWLRKLIGQKHDSSSNRSIGRPPTKEQIVNLVVQFAQENQTWGYTKRRDVLDNIGHEISHHTVANILRDHGIVPAPERGTRNTWTNFPKQHREVLAATNFFTVEVFTLRGIVRYHVLFVMRLATREAHIAEEGKGPWMEQIARNLADGPDRFLKEYRLLIHDRDPFFTIPFRKILKGAGVKCVRLPKRSPNASYDPSRRNV